MFGKTEWNIPDSVMPAIEGVRQALEIFYGLPIKFPRGMRIVADRISGPRSRGQEFGDSLRTVTLESVFWTHAEVAGPDRQIRAECSMKQKGPWVATWIDITIQGGGTQRFLKLRAMIGDEFGFPMVKVFQTEGELVESDNRIRVGTSFQDRGFELRNQF